MMDLYFKLLVTGTRKPVTAELAERLRVALAMVSYRMCPEGGMLIHGGASGIDTAAKAYWESMGAEYVTREFRYKFELGRAGGPARNQEMVDFGADLCLAFPIRGSVGTYDCARRAEAAHIPTFILSSNWHMSAFEEYVISHSNSDW